MRTNDAPHRVVIVGGGCGGLAAARALKRAPVYVTLVDRTGHHLEQSRLYDVATGRAGEDDVVTPLHWLLRRQSNAQVVRAEVTDIDPDMRSITADGLILRYDSLILAAGATLPARGPEDGAQHALGLKTLADARAIRGRLATRRPVTIVGGGPTGVDLAARIAGLGVAVTLLEAGPELLPDFPEPLRRDALRDLVRRRVDVRLGTIAAALEGDELELADGDRMAAPTVLWAAGVEPSPLARAVAGDPRVFVIGDSAAPGLARTAAQQGRDAARAITTTSHRSLKAPAYNAPVTI